MEMADIDNLSMLLGALTADIKEGGRQRSAIFEKLDGMETLMHQQSEQVTLLRQQVATAAVEHAVIKMTIEEKVLPQLEDYRASKGRLLAYIAGIGTTGGGVGAVLAKWWGGV